MLAPPEAGRQRAESPCARTCVQAVKLRGCLDQRNQTEEQNERSGAGQLAVGMRSEDDEDQVAKLLVVLGDAGLVLNHAQPGSHRCTACPGFRGDAAASRSSGATLLRAVRR